MKCPKCGFEQADGLADCQACGIIFAKWGARAASPRPASRDVPPPFPERSPSVAGPGAWPATPPPIPRGLGTEAPSYGAAVPVGRDPKTLAAALAGVGVLVLAAWWLNVPTGRSVPDGAYRDPRGRFALSPASDWLALTPGNFQEIFDRFGNRLPPAIRDGLRADKIAVGFMKMVNPGEFAPSINVVVVPGKLPPLTEKEKQEAAGVVSQQLSQAFEDYHLDEADIVEVDGLASLRLRSRGAQTIPTEVSLLPYAKVQMQLEQFLVRGKDEAYVVTCTFEQGQQGDYGPECERLIESFRVLRRPARFGSTLMGGLNGALIGAAVGLLKVLSDWFTGRQSR